MTPVLGMSPELTEYTRFMVRAMDVVLAAAAIGAVAVAAQIAVAVATWRRIRAWEARVAVDLQVARDYLRTAQGLNGEARETESRTRAMTARVEQTVGAIPGRLQPAAVNVIVTAPATADKVSP